MTDGYDQSDSDPNGDDPEDSTNSTEFAPPPHPPRKTPLQNEIDLKVLDLMHKVTAADRDMVAQMADPNYGSQRIMLTPVLSALIVSEYNNHNRNLQYAKVRHQSEAMKRGEWRWNHQGIAFYQDGSLADGQHRCYACALSGIPIPVQVTSSLDRKDIDTVDNQSVRNAGDACQLLGIKDPKLKARVMEAVAEYEQDFQNKRASGTRLTVVQIERLVVENDEGLDDAIVLAREIREKIATPVMAEAEIAMCALAMLRGGYPKSKIAQFTLAVNMGIGDYDNCPTTELAKLYERANTGDHRKWRLSRRQKMALFFKGAALFVEKKRIVRMKWDPKEELPSPRMPDFADDMAAE